MICVSRLDGSEFYINSDLIQTVESTPDTHIVLTSGARFVVREKDVEVVDLVLEFRRSIVHPDGGRLARLEIVRRAEEA